MIKVTKRNGDVEDFNLDKITTAIAKAAKETGEYALGVVIKLAEEIEEELPKSTSVEEIQDKVELALMEGGLHKTAKAYILYREQRNQARKRDIFAYRRNLKPYEYPELEAYKEAIQHSYWLFSEFNFSSSIQDFKVNVTDAERSAITRSMLAISQVEVAVKNFWGDLHKRLPKPELGNVGATFSENEIRHSDAYSHLLEILGLNDEFEKINSYPALNNRVNYLTMAANLSQTESDRDYTLSILLFSLFTEHVSLFSQFLIMMSFNKHKNLFKGLSNVIEATSKEEELHGQFGIDIINTIRNEKPQWFDEQMKLDVEAACKLAYESELQVIDWIYEAGDLEFMPKYDTIEFIKNRFNNSLESIGYDKMFEVDVEATDRTEWFLDEILVTKHVDFFDKRSVNYTKRAQSITADDLF